MRSKPLERSKTEADGDGIGFVPKSIGSGEQIREKYNGNCSKTVVFCQIFFRFFGSGAKPERTNSPQRIPPGYGSVFAVDFRSMRCAHSLGDSGSAAIRALCPELGGRAGVDPDGSSLGISPAAHFLSVRGTETEASRSFRSDWALRAELQVRKTASERTRASGSEHGFWTGARLGEGLFVSVRGRQRAEW